MKILVFSDTHLTEKFAEKKFNYLKKIISEADRVIINGDFWDGHLTTFTKFISSDWNKLFFLLKSKKAVYIYGNHDLDWFADKRTSFFSNLQTKSYRLKINGKTLVFEHGNIILPLIDEKMPLWLRKYATIVLGYLLTKTKLLQFILKKTGEIMKERVKKIAKKNEIYICGHSHWADFDLENHYINTGHNENGSAQYLIINNGKFIPKLGRYD